MSDTRQGMSDSGKSTSKKPGKSTQTIRWGIVGAGRIARRFAQGVAYVEGARVGAVWSRRAAPAEALAEEFGASACASFEALLASGIDAVYIATMQDSHAHYAIAALDAGLAVLCEKPATVNAAQLERVLDAARDNPLCRRSHGGARRALRRRWPEL
jgi:scyllo-inositol 2-dehydrogenase (NADP+)